MANAEVVRRRATQRLNHEGTQTWAPFHEPFEFKLAIRLQHRVRIDGHHPHSLLDRRQLVANLEAAQPQGVPDLIDDLAIGRDPGPWFKAKCDHHYALITK